MRLSNLRCHPPAVACSESAVLVILNCLNFAAFEVSEALLRSPIEILLRRKPNINNLRLSGSRVFVRITEIERNSKWDKKADIGILVSYENVGYRIVVNNKIIITRHVEFISENDNLVGF